MENTNNTNMLDTVIELFNSADAVTADDSPVLTVWEVIEWTAPELAGKPENEVVRLSWTDGDGLEFSVILTEGGISNGTWRNGCFHCDDHEGEPVVITFFSYQKMEPTAEGKRTLTNSELVHRLDVTNASLENVLLHHGNNMPAEDRRTRELLVQENKQVISQL